MSFIDSSRLNSDHLLTPECGHFYSPSNTLSNQSKPPIRIVVFHDFSQSKTRCICHDCYEKNKNKIDKQKRQSTPLQNDLKCILCNKAPSRFKRDWNTGCCDDCYAQNKVLEEKNVQKQVLPNNVLPDCLISDQLYIGPKETAANYINLKNLNISRVVVCCHSIPFYLDYDPSIHYLRLCMDDSLEQNIANLIPYAFAFIQQGLMNKESVLVHCNAGISRSGAICVAWLMKAFNLRCDQALDMSRLKREKICPNSNFIEQLKKLEP
jgi:protein-tyrosine phosphatase